MYNASTYFNSYNYLCSDQIMVTSLLSKLNETEAEKQRYNTFSIYFILIWQLNLTCFSSVWLGGIYTWHALTNFPSNGKIIFSLGMPNIYFFVERSFMCYSRTNNQLKNWRYISASIDWQRTESVNYFYRAVKEAKDLSQKYEILLKENERLESLFLL